MMVIYDHSGNSGRLQALDLGDCIRAAVDGQQNGLAQFDELVVEDPRRALAALRVGRVGGEDPGRHLRDDGHGSNVTRPAPAGVNERGWSS